MQNVQASLLPFHLDRKTLEVPEGLNLQEIVEYAFPRRIPGIEIVVNIGDEVIPQSKWRSIKPKSFTLVGVNAVAAGGGGGKKNPLAVIITIALIVAAPYIVSTFGASLAASFTGVVGPVTAGQFGIASTAIRIGIGVVGFLATSMLSSVPKQRAAPQASPTEPSSQFIEGASNKIDRYGTIPVNLGVNRMFPPQAALPYSETSANSQYVRQMFTYGFGKIVISDRRIGETSLDEYDGVEINDRLNGDLISGVTLYTNSVHQEGYSVLVSAATGYVTRTTQRNTDEADLDLTFGGGLTQYNDAAQRSTATVDFEVQYAVTGTGVWSAGDANTVVTSQSVTVPGPTAWNSTKSKRTGYAVLVLALRTGVVSAVSYDANSQPIIPVDTIRIASFRTESTSTTSGGAANILGFVDERASYIPSPILNSTDFAFTYGGTGLTLTVAGGTITSQTWEISDATAQALRVTKHLKFPANGQYDIRIKRLTVDSADDRIRDAATLTAIRSITYSSPINQPDISGTAIRMLATDQLNGSVDSYNCIVSSLIKDYDAVLDTWVEDVVTSNPASIFRYVLQSPAFVKRLSDARINIEKLEEWHTYCDQQGLTYNKIIDSPTSIDDLLNDIASAGMATTHKINGVYSVLIDDERPTFKGMVTPRNSWGYSGSITYPDLPHALRVQFRNSSAGYNTDERIVYSDGYNEGNSTLFERLEFDSCTNAALAWFYGRRYLATALLQPEIHTFNQDFENLTYNRGDKIVFVNDAILVGVGTGRIKTLTYDGPMTHVTGFTLDDVVNIPTSNQFGVRIRYSDASGFIYHSLNTVIGNTSTFTLTTPVLVASAPPLDSLCAFTEFGKELELIITEIAMNKDHSARITAVNYAPERFDATTGTIPPFDSNITLSSDFYRPLPPELNGVVQSDEAVMLKNSDGSYISRMLIPLKNVNEPSINVIVAVRPVGATQWFRPNILSSSPDLVIITGLEDGSAYDFRISYQRQGGLQLLSTPLFLNNTVYEGASAKPADVTGFQVTSSDSTGLFEWDKNAEIDLSHYVIKFTRLTTGVTWASAQLLADNVEINRISLQIQSGTYLIKAVDLLGNESENATTIVSFDNGAFNNVVELLSQQPLWAGTHDNTHAVADKLYLSDTTLPGYYYFDPYPFDLGDIYESILSSSLIASGTFYNRIRSIGSIRGGGSIRGALSTEIRPITSIRALASIRGIDPTDWAVFLEMRVSDDGVTYTDWAPFTNGKRIFRYIEFRLLLESYDVNISPEVSVAEVLIDMPDRYESEENVPCPPSGAIITYDVAFRNNPAVNITLQDGAVDDRLEYVYKTNEGFHVKVYNATTAGYVTRSLDYNSAGYGRIVV